MACGCGKSKMARPIGATPVVNSQTQQSVSARIVAPSSPYTTQQNKAPTYLQSSLRRTV